MTSVTVSSCSSGSIGPCPSVSLAISWCQPLAVGGGQTPLLGESLTYVRKDHVTERALGECFVVEPGPEFRDDGGVNAVLELDKRVRLSRFRRRRDLAAGEPLAQFHGDPY